jgi:succinyl-diaminopimelate desuccinylase|tara:strand:- start:1082 stop:2122 length:1041 start_codon:yes stop_codon:yes gene_type:complete
LNLVGTLEDLISINSVTGDEESILNFIEDFLIKNNFNGEIVRNEGGIIAIPLNSSKKVALVGHVDTVPVSDTQINTSDNDDFVAGRGTVDMKGGVAVILHTLINEGKDIVGVFYTAEEGPYDENGLGILMPILLSYSELEFAIIMEPTNNQIELGCLGALNATLKINGIAAHSARPWVGKNPIYDVSKITKVVLENEILDLNIEGLNYKQVLSITKISAGIANNVIPGNLTMNINFRYSPEMNSNQAHEAIESLFSEYGDITFLSTSNGAMPNIKNSHISDFIKKTQLEAKPKQAWTDIARFYEAKLASLNFGPGDPLLAHTSDERISKKQLLESYELLIRYLKDI